MAQVAPYVLTYAARTPYLTLAEFQAAPTGLDTTNLIVGGTTAQQQAAVVGAIERASSIIDGYCTFQQGSLAATSDTHYGRYRLDRGGVLRVPLKFKPILEVTTVQVGAVPSQMLALTDLSNVAIFPTGLIEIPIAPQVGPWPGYISLGSRPLVQVTYVNGYPNATLAADVTQAATSLSVTAATGIYPGTGLTVYDITGPTGPATEAVTVASTYVPGATTIPLTGPLLYAHKAGVSVSNLPPRVKEAAVLITAALIQTRGDDAIVLDNIDGGPGRVQGLPKQVTSNLDLAKDMLEPFRRVA